MRPTTRLAIAAAVAVIALDQLTKWLVLDLLMGSTAAFRPFVDGLVGAPPPVAVLPVFNLALVANRGVSFGLFAHDLDAVRWTLVAIALAIAIGLGVWVRRVERPVLAAAIGLVIGGALGNVIDRVIYGAVVDFLDVHVMGYHWPAFNVADAAITIGVVILLFDNLFVRQPLAKAPHQRDLP